MVTDTIINMKMKEKFRKGLNANVNFFAEINQFYPFNENYNYVKNSKYMSKHCLITALINVTVAFTNLRP